MTLREPLVPAEIDLRDWPFVPIYRARLFGSSLHARATDSEWRAAVTLWLKSWDQVPAGTLPKDDIELCRLAEYGRDLKRWRKVRDRAMHGWHECTDGRLHHEVVAEGVLEAWTKRTKAKTKGMAGAKAKWAKHRSTSSSTGSACADGTGISAGNACAQAQVMPGDGKGREEKGREEVPLAKANGRSAEIPNGKSKQKSNDDELRKRCYDRGKEIFGSSSGGVITNLFKAKENKPAKVLAMIEEAAEKQEPLTWVNAWLWKYGPPGIEVGRLDSS